MVIRTPIKFFNRTRQLLLTTSGVRVTEEVASDRGDLTAYVSDTRRYDVQVTPGLSRVQEDILTARISNGPERMVRDTDRVDQRVLRVSIAGQALLDGAFDISLEQPPGTIPRNALGEESRQGVPVDIADDTEVFARNPEHYTIWNVPAKCEERGGSETEISDAESGKWQARFTVRRTPELEALSETWALRDAQGNAHDIEAVNAAPIYGGDVFWLIYTTRRAPRHAV